MRVSSVAIFTLATLTGGHWSQQVVAASSHTTVRSEKTGDVVVPITEETSARVEVVAPPETVVAGQFSQKSVEPQSQTSNNSVVIPVEDNTKQSKQESPPNRSFESDLVVTATDVQIVGATEELQQIVRNVIKTQVGGETSQSQLQRDVAAILDTGLFQSANVSTSSTSTGLQVVYNVQPIVVRSLQLSGAKVLTYQVVQEQFQSQIGNPISPNALQQAVQQINKWYAENGYNVGRVLAIEPSLEGILTINVAEGIVSEIQFRFVNDEGKTIDDKGKPVEGRTKTSFLKEQLKLKPGQVFQDGLAKQDVQQLYRTGLFESVNVALEGDATKLNVVYQLKELGARSVNVGGNYNADQGLLGTFTYRDQNVGGSNDILGVNVQVGSRDLQFDSKFTSPYRATNPDRLGYSVNAFRQRGLSETFDDQITLPNGDKVREARIGGSLSFQRPIEDWNTSLGFNYARVSLRDRGGNISPTDAKGNALSLSGSGVDDLTTVSFTATKDYRDNLLNPTQGFVLSLSTEQSIPVGQGDISMNRVQANYSQFMPVNLFNSNQPQVFALNVQAGTVIGDLPPYETFNLGGPNSVRGYDSGDVGSGRTYVLASAEYRFPLWQALGGVLFADFASDLGSGDTVLGNPAGVRDKPGTGFGYGAGVRLNSPFGLLRADYGVNDQGETKVHFGIGHRF